MDKHLFFITGKVKHSQSLSLTPTHPWITVQEDGTVVMAHCTCKAGLGQVCSHAAALMYSVVAAVEVRSGQACTQKPCAWTQPSSASVSGVPYEELRNISFSHKEPRQTRAPGPDITPSDEECQRFLDMLHDSKKQESKPKRSAILSVSEGHSHRFIPKVMQLDLPTPLSNLFSSSRLQMDLPSLLVESAMVFDNLHLTQQQCVIVEEETREQSKSKVWFDQRAGRVTSSLFSEAARADRSASLIKRICYPRASQFSTEATRWGQVCEERATASYIVMMQDNHKSLQVRVSGFIINPEYPWIGASPDGLVSCACHGDGVLEIKCPFKARHCSLTQSCQDPSFCLAMGGDGVMSLKPNHKYMHQVQVQMHIAEASYCDFMVWTPQEAFTQRILYNPAFFHDAYSKVVEFIKRGVLPELLGKWYTAPRLSSTATELGCSCDQPAD